MKTKTNVKAGGGDCGGCGGGLGIGVVIVVGLFLGGGCH
jgi:hypothetical protein